MVSILDFLTILTLFSIGAMAWKIISVVFPVKMRKTELFNTFLICGTLILVFPLMLIGIQDGGSLKIHTTSHTVTLINFQGWSLLYFVIGLLLVIYFSYKLIKKFLISLEHFQFSSEIFKNYQFLILAFLLFDYFLIQVLLPLRGFDAFYYYFPEAEIFYETNRITDINYLSFLPVTKSPLNVLLYVYSLYTSGELAIQLIPFIFLVGLVFVAYDFGIEFFDSKSLARTAAILTLTLPFIYWLMNYWAFYQDLYLCYFFSVCCYFSWKWYKNPMNHEYALLIGFSMINTFLSKITGWVLPIILLLWIPTQMRYKQIRLVLVMFLAIFLCYQVATKIYIGVVPQILFLFIITGFLIIKEGNPANPRRLISFIPMLFGMILGGTWLLDRISLSNSVWTEIYNIYFNLSRSINWTYSPQVNDPLLFTLETVHAVNFISAAGFLFLSSAFVLPWAFLKISALSEYKKISPLLIWILVFFCIWSAYYFNSSVRYLTPIIVPFILCITWGSYQFWQKMKLTISHELFVSIIALFGCYNFFYFISIESLLINNQTQENVGMNYNQAALSYYSHPEILIVQILIFTTLMLLMTKKYRIKSLNDKVQDLRRLKLYRPFFIIVIIIPIAVPSYILISTNGNLEELHAIHEYEYRPEFKEMVNIIQQQNQPLACIMTVRTPGLQFFTKQPVLDIYYQNRLFTDDPFFTINDLSKIINILRYPGNYTSNITHFSINIPSIRYIVVPSNENLYYDVYLAKIKTKSVLFSSLDNNSQIFKQLFTNSDFKLYEVIFT